MAFVRHVYTVEGTYSLTGKCLKSA